MEAKRVPNGLQSVLRDNEASPSIELIEKVW